MSPKSRLSPPMDPPQPLLSATLMLFPKLTDLDTGAQLRFLGYGAMNFRMDLQGKTHREAKHHELGLCLPGFSNGGRVYRLR